jgi:hypothetical protein
MEALDGWMPAVRPATRIAFVGLGVDLELQTPMAGAPSAWRWRLVGPGTAEGLVELDPAAVRAFGRELALVLRGERVHAELRSRCERLALSLGTRVGSPWLQFRLGNPNGGYTAGEMRVTLRSVEAVSGASRAFEPAAFQ